MLFRLAGLRDSIELVGCHLDDVEEVLNIVVDIQDARFAFKGVAS